MLIAFLLAVLDFIPIIGSGTVLVPWAVICFALGDWKKGTALLIIWGVVCIFRRLAEPKALGSQTGLHPVLSLLSIYVGMLSSIKTSHHVAFKSRFLAGSPFLSGPADLLS